MIIENSFFLNGYQFYINRELTIKNILEYFNYHNTLFIVEYNNLICDRSDWSQIKIKSNDKLEIITIVGGG